MDAPEDGTLVPEDHRVLRLPSPPRDFVPDEGWKPTHLVVQPSDRDVQEAHATGKPVRVSVFDLELCTLEEAQAFRTRETLAYAATVAAIVAAGATAVVYDRLPAPDNQRPGAAGHAGIEGLERPKGGDRAVHKARLDAIAETFARYALAS